MNMDGNDVHSKYNPVSKVAVDPDLLLTSAVTDVIIKPLRFD